MIRLSTLENNFCLNFIESRKTWARTNQASKGSSIALDKLVFDGIFFNLEIILSITRLVAFSFEDWLLFRESSFITTSFSFYPTVTTLTMIILSWKNVFGKFPLRVIDFLVVVHNSSSLGWDIDKPFLKDSFMFWCIHVIKGSLSSWFYFMRILQQFLVEYIFYIFLF